MFLTTASQAHSTTANTINCQTKAVMNVKQLQNTCILLSVSPLAS